MAVVLMSAGLFTATANAQEAKPGVQADGTVAVSYGFRQHMSTSLAMLAHYAVILPQNIAR